VVWGGGGVIKKESVFAPPPLPFLSLITPLPQRTARDKQLCAHKLAQLVIRHLCRDGGTPILCRRLFAKRTDVRGGHHQLGHIATMMEIEWACES
jgi:hypothetical protein